MADLGRWFKLWCSSVHDPDLDNLSLENFGRWAKLGAIIKEQGKEGVLVIRPPSLLICAALKCETFDALINVIKMFPHVGVSSETNSPVSCSIEFKNWHKYQGDFSTGRVHKFRAKNAQSETRKKRGEENKKRREKNTPIAPNSFNSFWNSYPKKTGKLAAFKSWNNSKNKPAIEKILSSLEMQKKSDQWKKESGKFIPNPATWINQGRWDDEIKEETWVQKVESLL